MIGAPRTRRETRALVRPFLWQLHRDCTGGRHGLSLDDGNARGGRGSITAARTRTTRHPGHVSRAPQHHPARTRATARSSNDADVGPSAVCCVGRGQVTTGSGAESGAGSGHDSVASGVRSRQRHQAADRIAGVRSRQSGARRLFRRVVSVATRSVCCDVVSADVVSDDAVSAAGVHAGVGLLLHGGCCGVSAAACLLRRVCCGVSGAALLRR
jgi:hypothetical protein